MSIVEVALRQVFSHFGWQEVGQLVLWPGTDSRLIWLPLVSHWVIWIAESLLCQLLTCTDLP